MPVRRRFDGVHLRRNRSGLGLHVVFAESAPSPHSDHGNESTDNAGQNSVNDGNKVWPLQQSRKSSRRHLRRRRDVKSISLTLVGSNRAPAILTGGELSIGSDPQCDIVLAFSGILARHARVTLDEDGAMLRLPQPQLDVHLNHRRVESLAFLHDGDVIEIGGSSIAVDIQSEKSASPAAREEQDDRATRVRRVPPKFVLRGVTGSQFGKLIPIYGRLVIGRGNECDLVLDEPGLSRRHAIIETLPDGLFLRDLGSANGSYLNGIRVRDAALKHGDQIVVDSVRFLVQAIDQLDQPVTAMPAGGGASRSSRWLGWALLATAIFTAGVVTTLLIVR